MLPIFLITLLYSVSAQTYSRIYLQSLNEAEDARIDTSLVNSAVLFIENSIFTAAKKGEMSYSQWFEGCPEFVKRHHHFEGIEVTLERCNKIVDAIYTTIYDRFPDSDIVYDTKTMAYTLNWA